MSMMVGLLLVPVLIAMNAFFVATEYAVVASRPAQIEALRKAGRRAVAAALEKLKASPASAIGTIQICITMTNLLLGYIGEPAMSALLEWPLRPLEQVSPAAFRTVSFVFSFLVVTMLTVVFSELLPKALTLRYVPVAASLTAVPMLGIQQVLRPIVWIMNAMANVVTLPLGLGRVEDLEAQQVTLDELRLMATDAARDGVVTVRERSLVLNSLTMGLRSARQIMIPRTRVAHLDLQKSMDENRQVMNERLYSRLPLCNGGLDHVVGLVSTKEFLTAYHAAGESSVLSLLAQPAVFAPENITLDTLLGLFHEQRTPFVFLVDEYGGVEGIVTMRDVMDELLSRVEELPAKAEDGDGGPRQAPAVQVLSGETPLHELPAEWGISEDAGHETVTTLGGLVVAKLNRIPSSGERVRLDGVEVRILESDGRAVRRVEVRVRKG